MNIARTIYTPKVTSFISLICLKNRFIAAPLNGIKTRRMDGIRRSFVENLEVPEISPSLSYYSSESKPEPTVPKISNITPKNEIRSVKMSIFERLTLKNTLENKAISNGEIFYTRDVITRGKYLMQV